MQTIHHCKAIAIGRKELLRTPKRMRTVWRCSALGNGMIQNATLPCISSVNSQRGQRRLKFSLVYFIVIAPRTTKLNTIFSVHHDYENKHKHTSFMFYTLN
uniref:Uncharacterized protein n=1 Tax=Micrurus surinamensis TaxID=129470 RepID=A0A2D4P3Z2_MICSU